MSDPRTYEHHFETQMRRGDDSSARASARLAGLERRDAELTADVAERDEKLRQAELQNAEERAAVEDDELRATAREARQAAQEERLRIATTERDAALREVERRSAIASELSRQIPELEGEVERRDRDLERRDRDLE